MVYVCVIFLEMQALVVVVVKSGAVLISYDSVFNLEVLLFWCEIAVQLQTHSKPDVDHLAE
jgi:hypothetical protein